MEIMNFQSSVQASPHGELMILAVVLDPFSNMSAFNPKSIRGTEIINWCSEYYKKWFRHELEKVMGSVAKLKDGIAPFDQTSLSGKYLVNVRIAKNSAVLVNLKLYK